MTISCFLKIMLLALLEYAQARLLHWLHKTNLILLMKKLFPLWQARARSELILRGSEAHLRQLLGCAVQHAPRRDLRPSHPSQVTEPLGLPRFLGNLSFFHL